MDIFEKTLFDVLLNVMDQVWDDLPASTNAPAAAPAPIAAITQQAA